MGQTVDRLSNITVPDSGMEFTVSISASGDLQPPVSDGQYS